MSRDTSIAQNNFNEYLESLSLPQIYDNEQTRAKLSQTCLNMNCPTYERFVKEVYGENEKMTFDKLLPFINSPYYIQKGYITTELAHISPHGFVSSKNYDKIDHWINLLPLCGHCHDYFDNWNGGAGKSVERARSNDDEVSGYTRCKNIIVQKRNFHQYFDKNFKPFKKNQKDLSNAFLNKKGKFEGQINSDFYFNNFPNDNFLNCVKAYDKKLQSANKMRDFTGDEILFFKPVKKIKNSNEQKLTTANKHGSLLISSGSLGKTGNPTKLFKDYDDKGILHGYEGGDGTKSKWTNPALSIFANTNTPANCGFCGILPRHVEIRTKTSAAKMFDEMCTHDMKTNGVTWDEAVKRNSHMELSKLIVFNNCAPACPNCRKMYDKTLIRHENGNAYNQKKLYKLIEADKQLDWFNKERVKDFQNYDSYIDECWLPEHRYDIDPTCRGLSKKIPYQKYNNPFWDMGGEIENA